MACYSINSYTVFNFSNDPQHRWRDWHQACLHNRTYYQSQNIVWLVGIHATVLQENITNLILVNGEAFLVYRRRVRCRENKTFRWGTPRTLSIYTSPGSTLNLFCEATSTPSPEYKWYKNSQLLTSDMYNHQIEGGNLTISNVNRLTSGVYQCEAYNYVGELGCIDRIFITFIIHNWAS